MFGHVTMFDAIILGSIGVLTLILLPVTILFFLSVLISLIER